MNAILRAGLATIMNTFPEDHTAHKLARDFLREAITAGAIGVETFGVDPPRFEGDETRVFHAKD